MPTTIYRDLYPPEAQFLSSSFPQFLRNFGTNQPVTWLAYDQAVTESAYWEMGAVEYGGGDITVNIIWGASTATSGVVRWEAALMAVSPENDAVNPEAESFGTATAVDDTHLGTQAKRLMRATITLTSGGLDSAADGDELWVKISRLGAHANDTLSGDAFLKHVQVSWASP